MIELFPALQSKFSPREYSLEVARPQGHVIILKSSP